MKTKIPKIIHFVWLGDDMPEWAERNIAEFRRLNRGYKILVHGEEALLPCYRKTYDALDEPGEKCDLLRYSILEQQGGWYFDVDFWPLRPLRDAATAWQLDGTRLFCAVQTDPSKDWWLNGAMLAIAPKWHGWDTVKQLVADTTHSKWGDLGPRLVTRLGKEYPSLVEIAGKSWFYGPGTAWAGKLYGCAIRGQLDPLRQHFPDTGGQLPFAIHLWAHKHSDRILTTPGEGKFALVFNRPEWFDEQRAIFAAVRVGLQSRGYRTAQAVRVKCAITEAMDVPDLIAIWNGVRPVEADLVAQARRLGATVLFLEHGFWKRSKYVQVDPVGNLHRSSWASRLREAAPAEGAARIKEFYPNGLTPVKPRRKGYVLVLGQVPKDSQMFESEIQGPIPLQRAVFKAMPEGVPVYFRPHPQCGNVNVPANKRILPLLPGDNLAAHVEYKTTKVGMGLADALEGARFVITINSTAGNEALAAGVPVIAFGPALYCMAGVAKQTAVKGLRHSIDEMLEGWAPDPDAVKNYLHWLAARQWTADELAQGDAFARILRDAGVAP